MISKSGLVVVISWITKICCIERAEVIEKYDRLGLAMQHGRNSVIRVLFSKPRYPCLSIAQELFIGCRVGSALFDQVIKQPRVG